MRIDLSDLERLEGIAQALGRLFWALMAIAFLATILGSAGTGFLALVLGGAAFVGETGLEDFVRSRRERAKPRSPKPQIKVRRTRTNRAKSVV
ncbi:MAG TPA: hypothetical protein VMH33_03120 [Solirubrobacterales bacterium]|nr:hypothetical protein [Solirubrobacterales bacterium]